MSLEPDRVERLRKKLYEKAKREPDFRFYSLYDKVCWPETLQRSYRQAKANGGAAGVDGVRFEAIESYGVDRWLGELEKELVEETYRAQPVRRVVIPKPGGGERRLGIPTIRDRVAQGAVVQILEPIFEADFEEDSYGFRPKRDAQVRAAELYVRPRPATFRGLLLESALGAPADRSARPTQRPALRHVHSRRRR
jgi:RNA-directed DNA polymerase